MVEFRSSSHDVGPNRHVYDKKRGACWLMSRFILDYHTGRLLPIYLNPVIIRTKHRSRDQRKWCLCSVYWSNIIIEIKHIKQGK